MIYITKTKRIQIKNKLLEYIAEQEGKEFDYIDISNQLKLSHKQLFKLLGELKKEEKIVAYQKYLRKPILLSINDYTNFYWKVYIRSDKHPHSKLGTLRNKS